MSNWQIGPIPIAVVGDSDEPIKIINVAGWHKGNWGLDFRVFDIGDYEEDLHSGWMLTHLATGYSAFAILEPIEDAFRIADEINAMADWDFQDPVKAKGLIGIASKIEKIFGGSVTRKLSVCRGATFRFGFPA